MSWLKDNGSRVFGHILCKRGVQLENVRPGSTFRRVHSDRMVETAQVLSVGTDSYGIPHVRFQVSFRRPDRDKFDGGARMLALKSFADLYNERVPSVDPAAV